MQRTKQSGTIWIPRRVVYYYCWF